MGLDLFPDYFDHPQRVRFVEQEVGENIELFLRQHWITNVPWIFVSFIGYIFPPIFLSLNLFQGFQFLNTTPTTVIVGVLILWYLFVTAYALEGFLHWYFNVYIVTDRHIVDINFDNLLKREVLDSGLENIEGASSNISGIIRSLFNYGDVLIRTASEKQHLSFLAVPYPDQVSDRINDLRVKIGGGHLNAS